MVAPFEGAHHLAKPNYQYEKRQRELAKKAKKAEKAARKAVGKGGEGGEGGPADDETVGAQGLPAQTDASGAAAPAGPGTEAAGRD
jgi:hypothetical protein